VAGCKQNVSLEREYRHTPNNAISDVQIFQTNDKKTKIPATHVKVFVKQLTEEECCRGGRQIQPPPLLWKPSLAPT
jgi:hypothetical protein